MPDFFLITRLHTCTIAGASTATAFDIFEVVSSASWVYPAGMGYQAVLL